MPKTKQKSADMQTKPDGLSSKRSKVKSAAGGICGCLNPPLRLSISWTKAVHPRSQKIIYEDADEAILSVDRYSARKAMAKDKDGSIRLAFCRAHVRRDLINLAKDRPELETWAMDWVKQIGALYHLNKCRLELRDGAHKLPQAEKILRQAVDYMQKKT